MGTKPLKAPSLLSVQPGDSSLEGACQGESSDVNPSSAITGRVFPAPWPLSVSSEEASVG